MGVEVGTMRGIISAAVILVVLTVNVSSTAIEPAIPAPIQEPSRGERVLVVEHFKDYVT